MSCIALNKMDKKNLIKTLTNSFSNSQSEVVKEIVNDMINLLNMYEALILINDCLNDDNYKNIVDENSIRCSMKYYLDRTKFYCLNIKNYMESVEILIELLSQISEEEKK
jgi:hypothetical protein